VNIKTDGTLFATIGIVAMLTLASLLELRRPSIP
jgi:hypothetical protein